MTRRVLVVSPSFPPANTPDHQRVRMSLPYLPEFGWEAHVLAVDPAGLEGPRDPLLEETVPAGVPVTRVRAVPPRLTRPLGFGGLQYRAWPALAAAGRRLLARGRFDLVFFSTTAFLVMALGPRWRRRHGLPYVLDFQDPWWTDYYATSGAAPPGGRLRFAVDQALARGCEPAVVRGAAHTLVVSAAYVDLLRGRYPDVPAARFTVLPFGGPERDFAALEALAARGDPRARHGVFAPDDGRLHVTYLGRGGDDMAAALRGLFDGVARLRRLEPGLPWERLRLHFVGTHYAPPRPGAPRPIEALAQAAGVADLVGERPERLPYLQGLALLRDSHGVLVLGSDDPGYSPSKVYPCVLSGRPLLAVLHRDAAVGELVERWRAGEVVRFAPGEPAGAVGGRLLAPLRRLLARPPGQPVATDWEAFRPYTARAMTGRQCAAFEDALAASGPRPGRAES